MPSWWPFGKKEDDSKKLDEAIRTTEAQLRRQYAAQMEQGTSRQTLVNRIEEESKALEQSPETLESKARLQAMDILYGELRNEVLQNLSAGKQSEMVGQIEQAIAHYEQALADQVSTRFPYEHLRVIYMQRKQYEEMLRVCQTAVANPYLTPKDHQHFQKWAARLESSLE